jgi:hypothetical protein
MIKALKLERTKKTETYTIGTLSENSREICRTIELPDKNNARQISCIPAGKYIIRKHNSPKFKECLKVFDIDGKSEVKGRSDILIHVANYVNFKFSGKEERLTELLGCIAPVDFIIEESGGVFGQNSRKMLDKVMAFVGNGNVEFEII